jgi:hypothetical protein
MLLKRLHVLASAFASVWHNLEKMSTMHSSGRLDKFIVTSHSKDKSFFRVLFTCYTFCTFLYLLYLLYFFILVIIMNDTFTILTYIVIVILDVYTLSRGGIFRTLGGISLAINLPFIALMMAYPESFLIYIVYSLIDIVKTIAFIEYVYEPRNMPDELQMTQLSLLASTLLLVYSLL